RHPLARRVPAHARALAVGLRWRGGAARRAPPLVVTTMHMNSRQTCALVLVAALCAACARSNPSGVDPEPAAPAFAWELPPGFPAPPVPKENPMSQQKVELGRRLF